MEETKNVVTNENFDWNAYENDLGVYDHPKEEIAEAYDKTLSNVNVGEVVEGTVTGITKREVLVNIGYKSEGVIPVSEFRYNPDLKVGDKIEVYVESAEDKGGQLVLSHKKARQLKSWDRVNEALEKDEIIKGYIKCRTKGGMIVDVFGIEAFLPGSQIDVKPIRDYDVYVDKTMEFKVVKINQEFRNVVVSHKALIEAELEAQKQVIRQGAGLLVVVWADTIQADVIEAAKLHHCPIVISGHGAMNTTRYIYFAPSASQIMKRELVKFTNTELAEDVSRKMLQSRYHVYPVTDADGHLTGYVSRYHIMQAPSKKLILVDHNEFSQSVRAIEKAQVLEVIDHHRINDFSSQYPVQFRNEIVGSTCTIVATIFRENQIPIPVELAGLMLGAILSDTLNFHSPTTTEKDRTTANILAAIADLDVEDFATEMFTATASKVDSSPSELIKSDMKIFEVYGCKLAISQVIMASMNDLHLEAGDIQAALDKFAEKKDLDLAVLAFTSIQENGSVLYFGGNRTAWGKEAFPDGPDGERPFHEGLLSRKQQLLPRLTKVIEKYA